MDAEDAHFGWGFSGALCSNPAMSIIGAEDEDFENDLKEGKAGEDLNSHFNNIDHLREHPAHLLVFMQHVILQFDPAPLLCYLHADLFKTLNAKETKKQFVEFCNTFCDKGAILKVQTSPTFPYDLDRIRLDLGNEDILRRYVQDLQGTLAAEVANQLDDFRQKRMMGMTPCESELMDVENHHSTDRIPTEMKEKSVAEVMLEKMSETQLTIVADEEKCQSIFSAVAFYMKHLGVKTRTVDSKKSRGGFFRSKLVKSKKDESTKTKQRGGFPSIPWIGSNLDKEKVNQERKGPVPSRSSLTDPTAPSLGSRKSCSGGGLPSLPGLDVSDCSGNNTSMTNNQESLHTDDLSSIRLEPPTLSVRGDTTPVGLAGGLTVGEPVTPSDTPTEENLEKDSFEGTNLVPEGPGPSPTSPSPHLEEVDPRFAELEQDPPNWRELASPEALSKLSKKETKRQEVINELFATEHAHVRMLIVLQTVFSRPLEKEELLSTHETDAIFPSLDDIIEMHSTFYENLKKLRLEEGYIVKSISTTVLNRFGGTEGEWFQKLTARFCSHQSWALDQIKSRQKKDPRFNLFILDAESRRECRRLQLKDIIPIEMQRLTKYPLLLENIAKNTEDSSERESIQQSAECCRKVLDHVNEEVKVMENLLTLKDYQRRLDTSGLKPSTDLYTEYKNIDLTQKIMLYEGPLTWRITKEKTIEVQCVLLADMLVLLQKQDDKMVLKCQSKSNIAVQEGKQMLSPIIRLDSAFPREVATDRKAFYVIFTWDSGAQIYELVAQSVGDRKTWTEVIKSAMDDLKKSGAPMKLALPPGGAVGVTPAPLSPSIPDPLSPKTPIPLSPTENGSLKSSSSDRDKDSLPGDKSTIHEKVADSALDEVMSLKRLLISRISLSENSQNDGENGEEQSEKPSQEMDSCQSTEEHIQTTDRAAEEENDDSCEKEVAETDGEEEKSISAPLVLSQEQMEEVRRRLQSLEEKIKRLQTVEEDHHRLRESLSKFTQIGGVFQ
ncbi:rho guanine nucleotide exchange factor 1b isoform X2 [Scomber scombrus]|uniref:rho guanine nucleotide exchange factor 1b isoform X2 n=1 Tax=Scomber scombrus TaxID=13677 RepID=UPI002DDA6161|nr:rho guanine nucleotide exchange factor 1b isoform X2 [Scomber scombrus]